MNIKRSDRGEFMKLAIAKALESIKKGGMPYGACVVKNNHVIAAAHGSVFSQTDCTAHAEINAIRLAAKKMKTIYLEGCELYATCEPCPMCFGAINLSKITMLYYGADLAGSKKKVYDEMVIPVSKLKKLGKSPIKIIKHVLKKECQELFEKWKNEPGAI